MNTPNKRASAIGIGLAIRLILPIPDASVDQPDRQQVAYSYAGIQAASPIPIPKTTGVVHVLVGAPSLAIQVSVSDVSYVAGMAITQVSQAVGVTVSAPSLVNLSVSPASLMVDVQVS